MTAQSIDYKHSKIKLKSAIITLATACAFAIFFVEADVIIERMKSGLELVGGVIIPTLFPYMVLSEIIILSGIGDLIERMLGDAFSRIFNLPKCCSSAFILGILCGFPVGTKIAYSLYEKGKITDAELLRLLMFCNIQSISFIVNTVGGSLLGSRSAGIALYVTQVISAIIVGLILSKINTNKCYNSTRPIQVKSTKNSSIFS